MAGREEIIPVTYVRCAYCAAKNHCAACSEELSRALRARTGAADAAVDLAEHVVRVAAALSRAEIEDLLEGVGLMAD